MSGLQRRLLAALVVLCAACSESTSPGTVNAPDLESSFSTATSAFENNAAFQSIFILSQNFPQYAPVVGVAIPTLSRITSHNARMLRVPRAALSPQALFPANVLGKTLQWDTASASYVIGNMTGAPANGLRILLYFSDINTGQPTPNLSVLGYLELTDLSTPQLNEIGVLLRLASTTIAQYTITVINGTTSASAEAKGYMKDGTATTQVGFDLFDVAPDSSHFNSINDLTGADGEAIHVELNSSLTSDNLLTRLSKGRNSLELTAAGDLLGGTGPLTGAVKFNGVTVGTLGGAVDAPTVTGAGGHTLTQAETTALLSVFLAGVGDVGVITAGVFAPGIIVFHG